MRSVLLAAFLLSTLGSSCERDTPTAPTDPGFVQTVRIEPAEPRSGEQIRIWSEVTNRSPYARWATFFDCGLGTAGDLVLSEIPGTARCLSASFERELAPGESVRGGDAKVVDSPPGTYVLEVAQLVADAPRQRITVRVRE